MGEPARSPAVLSEFADSTCRSLMAVCSDFERRAIRDESWPGGSGGSGVLDSIVRCVGATEFFVFSRVPTLVDKHVNESANRMLSALYKQQASKMDSSWKSTVSAARDYLGIDIAAISPYDRVMAYVEVRNAAMHGNGALTKRQVRDAGVLGKLHSIGVNVRQGQLEVLPENLPRAARDCRALVVGVDGKTWSAPSRWL
jgi:hypothetical protein